MDLPKIGAPLEWTEREDRAPAGGEIRLKVSACGVCRTGLHVVDGELPNPHLPVIPGHELVGRIAAIGDGVGGLRIGGRVGVPWLGHTSGVCPYCVMRRESLCNHPIFTGFTRDGGFATSVIAGDGKRLGLYGFGAAAHILAQVAVWQGRSVYAFTRPGDVKAQAFARELGAVWAAGSDEMSPVLLDAAIIFATVGELVPQELRAVRKGGRAVCAGIHMSDIPGLSYDILWEERELLSVANLTRQDGLDFLALAPKIGIVTHTTLTSCGGRIRRWPICGRDGSRGRQCCSPDEKEGCSFLKKRTKKLLSALRGWGGGGRRRAYSSRAALSKFFCFFLKKRSASLLKLPRTPGRRGRRLCRAPGGRTPH